MDFAAFHVGVDGQKFGVGLGEEFGVKVFALADGGADDERVFFDFLGDGVFFHAVVKAVADLN